VGKTPALWGSFAFNMRCTHGEYSLTDDLNQIDLSAICDMLRTSYWANERPREKIEASFRSPASICFALLHQGKTVGCARLVTDRISIAWLADVFIHPDHRGKGLGKFLMRSIFEDADYANLRAILGTRGAHGLYEKFGFVRKELMMRKTS